jgi:hypothetical protein
MTYPNYIDTIFQNIGRVYLDHFKKRKDEDGKTMYVSQPYFIGGLHYNDIKHLTEIC